MFSDSVRFKRLNNISVPDCYVLKSELRYIKYQSGIKENADSSWTAKVNALLQQKYMADSGTKGRANKKSEMY